MLFGKCAISLCVLGQQGEIILAQSLTYCCMINTDINRSLHFFVCCLLHGLLLCSWSNVGRPLLGGFTTVAIFSICG